MYTTHRTVGSVIPHVHATNTLEVNKGMVEGRVHTHGTLERGAAAQRALRSVSEVVAKYGKPDLNSELSLGVDR